MQNLSIKLLIRTVIDADEHSQVSRSSFYSNKSILDTSGGAASYTPDEKFFSAFPAPDKPVVAAFPSPDKPVVAAFPLPDKPVVAAFPAPDKPVVAFPIDIIIDEEEFFAPGYDYDFTKLTETNTYLRGEEKYERPCGWYRFGLKVLDKYPGTTWLGTTHRSTQSSPGEWPVSYHGTSNTGASDIIGDHYEPGSGQSYGRGIYSTPDISVADHYAKRFISRKDGKTYKVALQNRNNPEYREKYNNDLYWLVPIPQGTSKDKEHELVERAIRPYGLLLKEV
ncbi:uncharacterized protein LOC133009166 [Limanda limanda]|uniref:uncharacterized protein LOC133009166 n=1 Tax=Limanda limanda TaxID=27771 RepID=UPI0029C77691|nr:uncharacterized protein LOC133009166 [Limanda limanda]